MANWFDNIPVPMDVNGSVVPLDTKELVHKDETHEVYGFVYSTRLRRWFVEFGEFSGVSLSTCTMPDSWEKLEEDVNLGCHDYCEQYRLEECDYNMRVHMLKRAKALAGAVK